MFFIKLLIAFTITAYSYLEIDGISGYSLTGIFIFSFFLTHFFQSIGNTIPIRALMVMISLLQWIIGPVLSYHIFTGSQMYYMIIPEEEYMPYVLSGEMAFIAGLYLFSLKEQTKISNIFQRLTNNNLQTLYQRGLWLIIIGIMATISLAILPTGLRFFIFLISFSKYIGAFYIFLTKEPLRWFWMILAFSFEVLHAFGSAMFHELILWGVFLYLIYAFISHISTINKLISMVIIISGVIIIQYIKKDYREVVWENKISNNIDKLAFAGKLAQKELSDNSQAKKESKIQNMVDRINQGWIIARIMYVVPQYEPFAEGETIQEGIRAALIPRILAPNKVKTGGQEYFPRFTGMKLERGTSMDLSIIGEAYANYGITGGVIFMFCLGLFYNLSLRFLVKKAENLPELILWIPLIYFYTVKAESDFTTSINHIVKASIVTYLLLRVLKTLLPYSPSSSAQASLPEIQ